MAEQPDPPIVVAVEAWWRKAWEVAPRHLRTRDWAEQHIEVNTGKRPGRFRLANNPILGPVLDLMDHPDVRETAGMKGVQTGISLAMQIRVARRAHTSPCQMLLVLPSKDAGIQQMKKRWKPILSGKGCPPLRALQRKRRRAGRPRKGIEEYAERPQEQVDQTTNTNIVLTNGFDLILGYSGSVQSLASNSCEEVEYDEVDKFNDWDAAEASPTELGRARTETFQGVYKLNQISTPTTDDGNIAVAFHGSDIRLYSYIPCPACGAPIQLVFENLRWDLPPEKELPEQAERARLLLREPHRVWIACNECPEKIHENDRLDLLQRCWLGTIDHKWQLHADGREVGKKPWGERVGYHVPTLASAVGMSIVGIAAEWVAGQGSIDKIKSAKTQHHGVPFAIASEKPSRDRLLAKCRPDESTGWQPPAANVVPAWASRLIMTVDTQGKGFYWVIRAWGSRMRSRLIAHGKASSFEELERLIYEAVWRNEDPTLPSRRVKICAIDSGGGIDREGTNRTRTEQVYRWCAADPFVRIALKGNPKPMESMTRVKPHRYQSPITGDVIDVKLMLVDPFASGEMLASQQMQQIELFDPVTGEVSELKVDLWELNAEATNEYLLHHQVMVKKTLKKGSKRLIVWKEETEGARHDFYDCERYQQGVAHDAIYGCQALPSEHELRAAFARASNQQQQAPTGVMTNDGREFLVTQR